MTRAGDPPGRDARRPESVACIIPSSAPVYSAGQHISLSVPSVVTYSVFCSGGCLPTALSSEQLRSLAAHGARALLLELESEMAAIRAAFPDLAGVVEKRNRSRGPARLKKKRSKISDEGRRRIAEAQRRRWAALKSEAATSQRPRKRASMSAAARKAVSQRMKTYWAQRRAARKK
jgi:hypothetical protein